MNQLDRWADFLIMNAISVNPSTETDLLWYIANDPDTGVRAAEILPAFRTLHSSPEYPLIAEKMQAYKSEKDKLHSLSGTDYHLFDINLSNDRACIRERIVQVIKHKCDEYGHDWQPRQTDKRCRRCGYVSDYDVNDIPF